MSLNLGGLATLSSITLSRPGGDDGETLATLKLSIGTKDTDPVCAALGTEAGDALEWGVGTASGVAGGAVVSDLSHDSPGVQGLAQLGRNAIDRVSELEREREETIRKLRDPVAVHVAMLRGEIAVPPLAELLHVYGATFSDLDAANIELAKARETIRQLRAEVALYAEIASEHRRDEYGETETAAECVGRIIRERDQLRAQLDEYERERQEPVAWAWNDALGCMHAHCGSRRPVWVDGECSDAKRAETSLRPLYAAPPVPHVDPDWLANVIRRADPRMSMTSDELAEKIAEAINGRRNELETD